MSQYNKTMKYWLQLKEDWFEDDSIKWLEEQNNGKEYSLFYLKLMCKTIKTNGFLIRQVGKLLIPYVPETLADLTKTDIDTVIVAMGLLQKAGLVEIKEDGAIFIEAVQKMISFSTVSAVKKQEQRALKTVEIEQEWTKGGQLSTKDKDKDIIIYNKKEYKEKKTTLILEKHKYGEYKNVLLTDLELEKLKSKYSEKTTLAAIEYFSAALEMKGYKYKSHYLAIIKWVFDALKEKKQSQKFEAHTYTEKDFNGITSNIDDVLNELKT